METGNEKKARALDIASDAVLFYCLFTNAAYPHTLASSIGLILLFFMALLRFLCRPVVYGSVWYIGYGLLILWGLLGALLGWAVDRATALAMCKTLCIDLAFVASIHQLIVQRRDIERTMLVFLAASAAFAALVILRYPGIPLDERLGTSVGVNPNMLALVLSVGFAVALHRTATKRGAPRAASAALLIAFAVLILLTGSRKGWLLLAIVPMMYLLWRDTAHWKRDLAILAGIGAAVCIAVFAVPALYRLIGSRIEQTMAAIFQTDGKQEGAVIERLAFLRVGFAGFLQRPLTGYGLDCFRFNGITRATYSHSNFIELLYTGGVPALAFFYAPLIAILVRLARRTRESSAAIAAVLTAGYIFMDFFMVWYYERPQLMVIALLLGAAQLALGGEGIRLGRPKAGAGSPREGAE